VELSNCFRSVLFRKWLTADFILVRHEAAEAVERIPVHVSGRASAAEDSANAFPQLQDKSLTKSGQTAKLLKIAGRVIEDSSQFAEAALFEAGCLLAKREHRYWAAALGFRNIPKSSHWNLNELAASPKAE
jgi:hypothetical protein